VGKGEKPNFQKFRKKKGKKAKTSGKKRRIVERNQNPKLTKWIWKVAKTNSIWEKGGRSARKIPQTVGWKLGKSWGAEERGSRRLIGGALGSPK